ncbi:hypothetical protein G6F23_015428 [Rhizopus arrhizus]|nr:hypothetical protein G6F23_015428 [Rhizopus arrhizus]
MSSRPARAAVLARFTLPRTRLSAALRLALPAVMLAAPWPSAVPAQCGAGGVRGAGRRHGGLRSRVDGQRPDGWGDGHVRGGCGA